MQIVCPMCHAMEARRSKRRTLADYLLSMAGVMPWRCNRCEARYHARAFPLKHLRYAHCAQCGNLEVQRISGEYVPGRFSLVGRILRLPALRCEPCRNKFFSVRPLSVEVEGKRARREGRAASQ